MGLGGNPIHLPGGVCHASARLLKKSSVGPINKDFRRLIDQEIRTYVNTRDFFSSLQGDWQRPAHLEGRHARLALVAADDPPLRRRTRLREGNGPGGIRTRTPCGTSS